MALGWEACLAARASVHDPHRVLLEILMTTILADLHVRPAPVSLADRQIDIRERNRLIPRGLIPTPSPSVVL